METLKLGKIVNTVGLKGEVKVYVYADAKEIFEKIPYVLLKGEKTPIESVRYIKDMAILKLAGTDDVTAAEKLREQELLVARQDAPALPPETYYVKDLMGLRVVTEDGTEIGTLQEVHKGAAQDLYEVLRADGKGTFLLPAVGQFVRAIDIPGGTVTVKLIEGLME